MMWLWYDCDVAMVWSARMSIPITIAAHAKTWRCNSMVERSSLNRRLNRNKQQPHRLITGRFCPNRKYILCSVAHQKLAHAHVPQKCRKRSVWLSSCFEVQVLRTVKELRKGAKCVGCIMQVMTLSTKLLIPRYHCAWEWLQSMFFALWKESTNCA